MSGKHTPTQAQARVETPQPAGRKAAKKPGGGRNPRPGFPIFHTALRFPDEVRLRLRELLVEGFTVQSAARYINQDPDAAWHVREAAVEEFARSDKQLAAERVAYMAEVTDAIIAQLGGGQKGDDRYARAVIRTGLLHMHEADTSLTVNQALLHRREVENLTEKNRLNRAKLQVLAADKKVRQQIAGLVKARTELITEQTGNLRRAVRKFEKKRNVTPETIQEIREVYGLIADNVNQIIATPLVVEAPPPAPSENDPDLQPEVYLTNPVDPQAEIQREITERARLLMAAPFEEESAVRSQESEEESETGNQKAEEAEVADAEVVSETKAGEKDGT